jgi:DNA-binding NarL/FixJ family response regulator
MDTIRILIADDHPVFRYGLRALLSAEADTLVVGEATTGAEALELATALQPDLILMDLTMPDGNGIEATRRILQILPQVGVLVVTMVDDDDSVSVAMKAGARGYLLKGAQADETVQAIRAVAHGEAVFSPSIARRLLRYFGTPLQETRPALTFPELTEREHEVLELIAQGLTNAAIAERLVIIGTLLTEVRRAHRA